MSDTVIRVEGLGKRYRIGAASKPPSSRLDAAWRLASAPFAYIGSMLREPTAEETLWALRDVSFEVHQGEVLGVIGRNGAGKSTLLKILSRITEPTEGKADIRGRVGSLLEVGTGFHPELTGRENIYLNGTILGMSKAEIARKFDEIVDFSGIERFIDTPVKRYSSGMYVRLGFAVAAHLETEVLLVDEVLAVGDAPFQKKCLGKMGDVAKEGRTVLFVSHNMKVMNRLCPRAVLLSEGNLVSDGPTHSVTRTYLESVVRATATRTWPDIGEAPGNEFVRLRSVRICKEDDTTTQVVDIRKPVGVQLEFNVLKPGMLLSPNFYCTNEEGIIAFISGQHDPEWQDKPRPVGHYVSTAWIPGNLLSEGTYVISPAISTMNPIRVHCWEKDSVAFQVVDPGEGDSARGNFEGHMPGVVRPLLRWTTNWTAESHT